MNLSNLLTVEILRKVPIFSEMEEEHLSKLAARCHYRRFRANQALFHTGDPGQAMYVILSGQVRIQRETQNGEVVHLALCGPGEPVGEMALIDGKPRCADAVTAEACDLLMLDRSDFRWGIESSPRMAFCVLACLADRLRATADRFERYRSQDVLGRVASAILEMWDSQAAADPNGVHSFRRRITQRELADRTGTTRESVNRAMARLKEARVIQCEGRHLVVTDASKLRHYCQR